MKFGRVVRHDHTKKLMTGLIWKVYTYLLFLGTFYHFQEFFGNFDRP